MIIASVIPSAIARAVTATALRASEPPKNAVASRPAGPKSRAKSGRAEPAPARTAIGEKSASASTTSATAANPRYGKPAIGRARDERAARRRTAAAAAARGPRRRRRIDSVDPGRIAGAGSTRIASAAGRSTARKDDSAPATAA